MMELSGQTVLITGGGSGIGYALAEAFLSAGSRVAVCGRRDGELLRAQKNHPDLLIKTCDVSKEEDRLALLEWAGRVLPDLNVLVNNAGIQRDIDFTGGVGEFLAGDNEIRVNLEAPIVLSGIFIPLLRRNRNPAIINVSSGLGFIPSAKTPVYSASKAGIHAFSMALRHQLKDAGFQVFEIVPPAVDTGLNPEGRAKRGHFKPVLGPMEFVASVMKDLERNIPEIGYGDTENLIRASRPELDRNFERMNRRMQ